MTNNLEVGWYIPEEPENVLESFSGFDEAYGPRPSGGLIPSAEIPDPNSIEPCDLVEFEIADEHPQEIPGIKAVRYFDPMAACDWGAVAISRHTTRRVTVVVYARKKSKSRYGRRAWSRIKYPISVSVVLSDSSH